MTTAISNIKNNIISSPSKYIEVLTIPVVSGFQTYEDCKKADKKDRKNILAKDIITLSATCAGAYGATRLSKKLFKNPNSFVELANIPLGGIIGGFVAGTFAEKVFPTSESTIQTTAKDIIKKETNSNIGKHNFVKTLGVLSSTCLGLLAGSIATKKAIKYFNISEFEKTLNITGVLAGGIVSNILAKNILGQNNSQQVQPIQQAQSYLGDVATTSCMFNNSLNGMFNTTFSTMGGYSIAKEQGVENKIKKSCFQIVSGIVVPATIIVPTINFIDKKISQINSPNKIIEKINEYNPIQSLKNKISNNTELQKSILQKSFLIPITVAGMYLGSYIGEQFNKKVTEKLVKKELWAQVVKKHEDLMKMSLNTINSGNIELKKQILGDLDKVKKLETIFNPNQKVAHTTKKD